MSAADAAGVAIPAEGAPQTVGVALPVGAVERKTSGWAGIMLLILTEGSLFAYLLFGYYYFLAQQGHAFLPSRLPEFRLSAPNTAILLASSVACWWGDRGMRRGWRREYLAGTAIAVVLGTAFVAIQGLEWQNKGFTISSSSYGSLYYTITGFHMVHVLAGLVMLAVVWVWSALGLFDRERHAPVSIVALYWHFVDVVWLAVFFTLYLTPYLI